MAIAAGFGRRPQTLEPSSSRTIERSSTSNVPPPRRVGAPIEGVSHSRPRERLPALAVVRLLFRQAVPALFHFCSKLAHGLFGNDAPLASAERGLSLVDSGRYLRTRALTFFPQSQSLFDRLFFAAEPPGLNRLSNKRFLVRSQLHFHHLQDTGNPPRLTSLPNAPRRVRFPNKFRLANPYRAPETTST